MSDYIKISLDTGLFNAGVVGLIKLLEMAEEKYNLDEQYIEVKKDFFAREDLANLYLDMIFITYKNTDRFGKLINIDFTTCDEKILDDYTKLFKNKTAPNICETYKDTGFVALMNEFAAITKKEIDAKRAKGIEIRDYLRQNEDLYRYIVIGHATREELGEFFDSMAYLALSQGNKLIKKNTPFLEALNEFIFTNLSKFAVDYDNYLQSNKDHGLQHRNISFFESDDSDLRLDKYQCLQCRDISFPNKKLMVEMKFLVDFADDPGKKQSPFWNFEPDANLCPICAFVYMLMPFGFADIAGRSYKKDKLFINDNSSVEQLWKRNKTYAEQEDLNKYKVINAIVLDELKTKQEYELNNIELILRENYEKRSFYSYSVLGQDVLEIIRDAQNFLKPLSRTVVKTSDNEYINIFAEVLNNLLNSSNQWNLMQTILRLEDSTSGKNNNLINNILQIQIKQNKAKECGMKNEKKIISAKMSGITIKRYFGTEAENKLRSYIYKLINALGTGNRDMFLDAVTRMYSGINMEIPSVFFDVFSSDEDFKEIGYAYVLGLKGGEYQKKDTDATQE
ncbi:MAG: type I-B CRISPR-associated protein Cas8b1/Cst1 [Clostridia bacterium]